MSEESHPSPTGNWRWAHRIAVALVAGVAALTAARHDWLGAAVSASLACTFAFFPTAVLAQNPTKVQQTRYMIALVSALVFQLWQFVAHVAH